MTALSFDVPTLVTHKRVAAAIKHMKDDPFDDGDREIIKKLRDDYGFDCGEIAEKWGVHSRTLRAFMRW